MQQGRPKVQVTAVKYVGLVLGVVPLLGGLSLAAAIAAWWEFFTHLHVKPHRFGPQDTPASIAAAAGIATAACLLFNGLSWGMRRWVCRFPHALGMSRAGWRVLLGACSVVGFATGVLIAVSSMR